MLLDDRFRLEGELGEHGAVLGQREGTGEPIVAFELPKSWAEALRPIVGLEHRHVAKLHAVLEREDALIVVAEHVPGETLEVRLARVKTKPPVDAVRSALRVADALATLHEAGGAHGLVHPSTIVVEPDGRDGPVLTYRPVPDLAVCRSPGRDVAAAPVMGDDDYAVAAALFEMLTGRLPKPGGIGSEQDLEGDIPDADLRQALWHALNRNAEQRSKDLKPFKRELARWYVKHAGEELAPLPSGAPPPPLPPFASRPPAHDGLGPQVKAVAAPAPPPKRKMPRWVMPVALGALVLGLGVPWLVNTLRGPSVEVVEVPKAAPAAAAAAAQPSAIDLGEVPVTGEEQQDAGLGDQLTSCVAGHLPKGSFLQGPDVSWLCTEPSAVEAASKLRVAIVAGSKGQVTDARKMIAKIGWYELPLVATIRSGCCEAGAPLQTPEPSSGCENLAEILRNLTQAALSAQQGTDEALKRFATAASCEANAGKAAAYRQKAVPDAGEEAAFRDFLKAIEAP